MRLFSSVEGLRGELLLFNAKHLLQFGALPFVCVCAYRVCDLSKNKEKQRGKDSGCKNRAIKCVCVCVNV